METKPDYNLVDTHAHLASSRFAGEVEDIVARADDAGVSQIVSIACDIEDCRTNLELAKRYPAVFPTVGIHPLYVHELSDSWFADLSELARSPEVAAIAEIGLDYYHPPQDGGTEEVWRRRQREVFEKQLQLSIDLGLSVVIHQRNSSEDVFTVLENFPEVRAVLHCFGGTEEETDRALAMGLHLSFTGILTFKNAASVKDAAAKTPLDRVMLETDAPFLAPVPFRGKRCEPAMMTSTASELARIHDLPVQEIAELTTRNARNFFRGLG